MEQEIVIISDKQNSSKKGAYFEKLVENILIHQRYKIDRNVNGIGQEFDLTCTHMDRSNEKILIECKAKESLASSDLNLFNFKVSDNGFTHGIFVYNKNFEHQVKGTIDKWKQDLRYKNLSFWNGAKVIELLIASKQIKKFEFSKNEFQLTKVILFFSYEGFFYIPLFSDTTQPKFFSIYKAKTLERVTDKNIIELVKKYIKDTKNIDFYEEKQIQNTIKESSYKIIDLHTGIGDTRLGFQNVFKEKAEFIFSCEDEKMETNEYAKKIYENNFKKISDRCQKEKFSIDCDICLIKFKLLSQFYDERYFLLQNRAKIIFCELDSSRLYNSIEYCFREELKYKFFAISMEAIQRRDKYYIIGFSDHKIKSKFKQSELYFQFSQYRNQDIELNNILDKEIKEKFYISKNDKHNLELKDVLKKININLKNNEEPKTLIIKENGRYRKLTLKEVARLKGFPDSFNISSDLIGYDETYKLLVQSSNIPIIELLAKSILEALDKCK